MLVYNAESNASVVCEMAWSVNCRLIVAQLTLALLLLYLYNISRMIQLDRQLRHSESNHLPHPIHPRYHVDGGLPGPAHRSQFSRSQNAGRSDAVRCPHTRKPNAALEVEWQRQDHASGTIYIYSAVYDSLPTQSDPDSGTVRLLVLASGLQDHDTSVYCQVCSDGQLTKI